MDTTEKKIDEQSRVQTLAMIGLFGLLIYLYYPYIQNYSTTPKWVGIGVLALLVFFTQFKKRVLWSLALSLWSLFVLQFALRSFASYNFWDALVRTTPLVLAPLIVILVIPKGADLKKTYERLSLILAVILAPLLLYALFMLLNLVLSGEYSHAVTYDFRFTFGHRNQFAQVLTLSIPIMISGFVLSTDRSRKWMFLSLVAIACVVVTLLLNRTTFIVLYGVYPVFALIYLVQRLSKKKRTIIYSFAGVCAVAGVLVLMSPIRKNIPVVGELIETGYGSGNERVRIWKNSVDIWKQEPMFGKGSGDWKIEILNTSLTHTQAEESMVFYQRAHNEFIQTAVENGVVGLVLLVLFFAVAIYQLAVSDLDRAWKLSFVAGVFGFLVIANLSFPLEKIELLVLLFLLILPGFVVKSRFTVGKWLEKGAILGVLFMTLLMTTKWFGAERAYFEFLGSRDKKVLNSIDKDFYTINPTSTPTYWEDGNYMYERQNYERALKSYKKALVYNPNHVHALNNTGSCYYALGNNEEAEYYYQEALKRNPKFVETLMNYAALKHNQGDFDGALNAILEVPLDQEPENFKMYMSAIARSKYKSLVEIHDEPLFEQFLVDTYGDDSLLYDISVNCRNSWRCYEDELRIYFDGISK